MKLTTFEMLRADHAVGLYIVGSDPFAIDCLDPQQQSPLSLFLCLFSLITADFGYGIHSHFLSVLVFPVGTPYDDAVTAHCFRSEPRP